MFSEVHLPTMCYVNLPQNGVKILEDKEMTLQSLKGLFAQRKSTVKTQILTVFE